MRITDKRRDINGVSDVKVTCEPLYEQEEAAQPTSFKWLTTGPSYTVDIKLQYRDQCIPMRITSAPSPIGVETKTKVILGLGMELDEPRPIVWSPGHVYKLRKIAGARASETHAQARARIAASMRREVKVKMTMRYGAVRKTLFNTLISAEAEARDVVNA
jgi:hypothetical protein